VKASSALSAKKNLKTSPSKKIKEELRKSEERFRLITTNNPDHILIQNANLRYSFVLNPQLGLTQKDIIGKTDYDILSKEDAVSLTKIKKRVLETGKTEYVTVPIVSKKGNTEFFEGTYAPIRNSQGQIDGIIGYFKNITERKKTEEELRKLNRILTTLNNSSKILNHKNNELGYLNDVCNIILKNCGYSMVWIGYAENDECKSVRPVAYAGFEKGYLETLKITWSDTNKRSRGPTGTAIRTGKISICRNMLTDPAFAPWREEALKRGYASSIALPLTTEGKTFGAMMIYSSKPDPFSDDELKLLSELSNDLSHGIAAIKLRKEHEQLEILLQKKSKEQETILNSVPAMVFYKDKENHFISTNKGFENAMGLPKQELIGKSMFELYPKDQAEHYWKDDKEVIESGKAKRNIIESMKTNSGTVIVRTDKIPYLDELNNVIGVIGFSTDITQREKDEEKLRNFSKAVEQSSASIVITDLNGLIEYVNQGFVDITGYTREEIMGKNTRILKSGLTSPGTYQNLWKTIILGKEWKGEFCNKKKNGEFYWEQVSISPVKNAEGKTINFLAVKNDITDLKKTEDALRENREQLNLALTAAKMGTFVWDIVHDKRIWDDNVHRLFGIKLKSFSGSTKEFLRLIHPDDRGKVQADLDKAIKTGIYDTEYRAVWPGGNIAYIAARGKVYYDKSKKPVKMVAVCWDITELKNLDQRKDDFITIAGHELRTPVSAIKIMNQILQEMLADNPRALKYLKKIENQSQIQSTLINDLLSVSKIQTGKLEINKRQFNLQNLTRETVEDMQETTKEHKIIFKTNTNTGIEIFTDEERVRQVLVNFCSNAIKFSPDEKKIIVEIKTNQKEAVVSVSDFGIGIPKTNHSKIFDRFYRVYGSGNKSYPGLGMGLYISYQIIKLLGGKMWFESAPGKGSTFYFSLPFKT
jgi:two-component system, sensor histidine kinase and response regulator